MIQWLRNKLGWDRFDEGVIEPVYTASGKFGIRKTLPSGYTKWLYLSTWVTSIPQPKKERHPESDSFDKYGFLWSDEPDFSNSSLFVDVKDDNDKFILMKVMLKISTVRVQELNAIIDASRPLQVGKEL